MTVRLLDVPDGAVIQRDVWVPLPDGVRLHARLWLPEDADRRPVPALLEYLPYRLDDWTSVRDSERHPYYAMHGYASVRVDIRGTGSSEGLFDDEYSETELTDAEDVIAWLCEQPWCDGTVGMFGISWGGFNALQVAARRPPALKAVVTCCSSVDRYRSDVHYIGGAVLGIDMAAWSATMFAFGARPPRPEVVGESWVERWRERLENQQPLAPVWLSHQQRDEYWRRGSVCESYDTVQAAVLAVGGWADPYHDAVLLMLEHLPGPRKGLLGPWAHQYPDRDAVPGGPIGFLQETLRWWDHWLKGRDTGVEDDPDLRVWIGEGLRSDTDLAAPPGRWRAIRQWRGQSDAMTLALDGRAAGREVEVDCPWETGRDAGRFFPMGKGTDLAPDQRAEDERSVCIDLEVGPDPVEVLGFPELDVRLRSSEQRANLIVRLCDVAPDDSSALVTRGVLNLARRHGADRDDPMPAGRYEQVRVMLASAGHRFAPGHRIRVALSNHYWPWVWPQERGGTLQVDLGRTRLRLPKAPEGGPAGFLPAEHARPVAVPLASVTDRAAPTGELIATEESGTTTVTAHPAYGGSYRFPDGLVWDEEVLDRYVVREGDPLSPSAESHWVVTMETGQWGASLQTWSRLHTEPGEFVVDNHVRAWARRGPECDAELVADLTHRHRVPRTSA